MAPDPSHQQAQPVGPDPVADVGDDGGEVGAVTRQLVVEQADGGQALLGAAEARVGAPGGAVDHRQAARVAQIGLQVLEREPHALLHLHDLLLAVVLLRVRDEDEVDRQQDDG
ncbi:MAG: hypothetical protein R3F43_25130 [bacterium]